MQRQRGFTLLEIMVVIVILGILASLVVPNLMGNKEKADRQKVVSDLVSAGYLDSVRGRHGGIRLARPPGQINVGALIRHTEQDFELVECSSCLIASACGLTSMLDEALAAFLEVLNGYTLADVLARQPDFSRFLHQTAKS